MMGNLTAMVDTFKRYRYLLGNLVQRDITVKYRRSVLGWLWSVLNPLLMMLVQTLVFSTLFQGTSGTDVVRATGEPPPFSIYLLSGMLVFNFFSEATQLAMESVLSSAPLIKKVYIPKYIFPLEKVIFSLINVSFSLVALIAVMVVLRFPVTLWALLFPVPLLLMAIFNLGVGLILSALTVFFRDIKHFYGIIVLSLNYLTPIFYTQAIFDGKGTLSVVMPIVIRFNPLYWYVAMFRQVVVYGNAPTMLQCLLCSACAVVALVLGLIIFKKAQDRFILYV